MGKGGVAATLCEILLAIFLPPLGVFFKYNCGVSDHIFFFFYFFFFFLKCLFGLNVWIEECLEKRSSVLCLAEEFRFTCRGVYAVRKFSLLCL